MKKTLAGLVIGVSVFAIAAWPASATLPGDPSFRKRQSCGTVDFGFTDASVSAKHVSCPQARKIVRKWSKQPGKPIARVTRVKNFRCVFEGSEIHLTLRCKNVNHGRKRVNADWVG